MPAAAALTRLVELESRGRILATRREGVVGELCRMLVARVSTPTPMPGVRGGASSTGLTMRSRCWDARRDGERIQPIVRCLRGVAAAGALVLVAVSAPAGARNGVDTAQGGFAADVSCQWGARDCNPPVRALVSQFRRLRDHGDLLGFRMGPAPDVSMSKHWQGVQRLTANQGRFRESARR